MNNLIKVANPIINQVTPEERGCTASKNLGKNVEKMEKHFHEAENRYHSGNDFIVKKRNQEEVKSITRRNGAIFVDAVFQAR